MSEKFSGDIEITKADGSTVTVHISGENGNITLGGDGADGDVVLLRKDGTRSVHLDGHQANLILGGNGADGDAWFFSSGSDPADVGRASIHIDGDAGDIVLRNADLAEDFDVVAGMIEPGAILVINDAGQLEEAIEPYDQRVVGVASGAGTYRPGLVLDRQQEHGRRLPVSLTGKVYCQVDATDDPIRVGDLLTTSNRPGYAMAVKDHGRASGAVVGKALAPLADGVGQIPILVALQ